MMGVDEGLANDQPGILRQPSRLMIEGKGTERLMVAVSPLWLTVRGMAADAESGGETIGMWG